MHILKTSILSGLLLTAAACISCQTSEPCSWKEMEKVYNQISPPTFPDKTYVITDYYNGKDSLYTDAINRAIEACSSQGGGTVLVPDGEFLTAPIRLKSNVNLHLSDSTILKFTTDYNLFETVLTRIEGIDCHNISPLIYAYGENNIAITGKGKLDGQASTDNWFAEQRIRGIKAENGETVNEKTLLYQMKEDSIPVKERVFEKANGIRPQFINLYKCKNILLEGFTIKGRKSRGFI